MKYLPFATLLVWAGVWACGGSQPKEPDAGFDAGGVVDAGRDAGSDPGSDANPPDAGSDAGFDAGPDDGESDAGPDNDQDELTDEYVDVDWDNNPPDPDWPEGDPADFDLDPAALEAAWDYGVEIESLCLVVIRDSHVVFERYQQGEDRHSLFKSWSIAKSFSSTLIGIAITRGDIQSVHESAANYITEWQGTGKEAITIQDILRHTTGLEYNLIRDNVWTITTRDQTAEAVSIPLVDPVGEVWHYANRGVQTLHPVLQGATGMDPEQYAEQHLWGPIGMNLDGPIEERTHWERDRAGNPMMPTTVYTTCRDLARLGYLYLHKGKWGDRVIVDRDYVIEALSPSQDLNRIYGYLWWLNGEEPAINSSDEPFEGTMFNFAPDDLYSAQGIGQNFLDVVPSTNTIYVHMRKAPHDGSWFEDLFGMLDELFRDSKQIEHTAMLELLLQAG